MRREKGGAMVFVLMLLAGVAVLLLATSSLTSASLSRQQRREADAATKNAFDGITDLVVARVQSGAITGASPLSGTVGTVPYEGTVVDDSAANPHTWKVSATLTYKGRPYTYSRVIPKVVVPSPYTYAIFAEPSLSFNSRVVTGANGENGDIGSNGALSLVSGSTVNGNVEAPAVSADGSLIQGTIFSSGSPITVPAFDGALRLKYLAANPQPVTRLIEKNLDLGNNEFWYAEGNYSISGSLKGKGTVFVDGNLEINHHLRYSSSSDCVAFVVTGNITLTQSDAKDLCGYFYCGGNFESKNLIERNLLRGSIVTKGNFVADALFTATNDPLIWKFPQEAKNLKLPGYW